MACFAVEALTASEQIITDSMMEAGTMVDTKKEQERDELHLTGKFGNKEYLVQELQKYVRQVFIMNPATNLDFQAITSCE